MHHAAYVEVVGSEGARMLEVSRPDLTPPVPFYPDWTRRDLLVHTGSIHRRTTRIVSALLSEPPEREYPPSEEDDVVLEWFDSTLRRLVEVLADCDATAQCWALGRITGVGFWIRRMAHETAIHRWDAESCDGEPAPLSPEVAEDGIDEFADLRVPGISLPEDGVDGTVALEATEGGRWLVVMSGDGVAMARGEAGADARVGGPASDLYLRLMGRPPREGSLTTEGADVLIAAWWKAVGALAPAVR